MRRPGRTDGRGAGHPPADPVLPPVPGGAADRPGFGRGRGPAAAAHGTEGGASVGRGGVPSRL
ncbi:hypothetical protein M3765_10205 [Streptomyces thermoviolaceus]|nr:hypothetical protein [Streptomyces thermoviolaceus]